MIRARTALTERSRGVFYRKRDPFLHFHEDPAGLFCDVKIDGRFRRHPATTKAQQRTLLVERDATGTISTVLPITIEQNYRNELEIYTAELQQIFQSHPHTLIVGGRLLCDADNCMSNFSARRRFPRR